MLSACMRHGCISAHAVDIKSQLCVRNAILVMIVIGLLNHRCRLIDYRFTELVTYHVWSQMICDTNTKQF